MKAIRLAVSVALGLGVAALAGCKDDQNKPNPQAGGSNTSGNAGTSGTGNPTLDKAAKQAEDLAKSAGVTAGTSGATASKAIEDAAKAAEAEAKTAADAAKAKAGTAAGIPASGTPVPDVSAAGASMAATATPLLDKFNEAINAKKWDEAKGYLDKLNAIKDKLPDNLKSRLTTLQALYESGKGK